MRGTRQNRADGTGIRNRISKETSLWQFHNWADGPPARWEQASYLGGYSITPRFLQPVQWDHLSAAPSSLVTGEGDVFTTVSDRVRFWEVDWLVSGRTMTWQDGCEEGIFLAELVSLCLEPLHLHHNAFRTSFPVHPSLDGLSGPLLTCLCPQPLSQCRARSQYILNKRAFGKRQVSRFKPPPRSTCASEITLI